MSTIVKILVCQTCPRYEHKTSGSPTRGRRLANGLKAAMSTIKNNRFDIRVVNCLAGCKNPCNISFDNDGKTRLRLSKLSTDDIDTLFAVAKIYAASDTGELQDEDLPEQLRNKISNRTPPPSGA